MPGGLATIDEDRLQPPKGSGKVEFEVGVQDRTIAGAHRKQGGRRGQQPIGTRELLRGPSLPRSNGTRGRALG